MFVLRNKVLFSAILAFLLDIGLVFPCAVIDDPVILIVIVIEIVY